MRHPTPAPPAETGTHDGLAYTLWLPDGPPEGAVLVIHGADSTKENHHDFARAARAAGLAALAFDQRGHGESGGELDGRALEDVATMGALLRAAAAGAPLALRGSSMGGYMAIAGAAGAGATAVVAICPAGSRHLLHMLRTEELGFRFDLPALERLLSERDVVEAAAELPAALLLLHAEGDERIPAEHSRLIHDAGGPGPRRLVIVPGGHHRSIQHDDELQGESLRFIARALTEG
jgi:alpha-beta hydrolase superfamily lysophospholipase